MSIDLDVLEAQVLQLPRADRAHLFERLIASLDSDSAIEQAWELEADRREAALATGLSVAVPGAEAIGRLRAKLAL